MTREILFKGLRVDGEGWVEGVPFPIYNERKCFMINNCNSLLLTQEDSVFTGVEVDSSTVSQFTGILDKNGTKVFEGDKLMPDEAFDETKVVVRYDNRNANFVIDSYGYGITTGEGSQEVEDSEESVLETYGFSELVKSQIEVIGNMHEEVNHDR